LVRYDDFLNGSNAAPEYSPPAPDAMPTRPQDGTVDRAAGGGGSSSREVLIAFFVLFGLLVFSHVITLDVQA
jgi:hypothetical protein